MVWWEGGGVGEVRAWGDYGKREDRDLGSSGMNQRMWGVCSE